MRDNVTIRHHHFKKTLIRNSSDAEAVLWHYLRNRRFFGLKFRRQHCFHGFIVDFICLEKKLIIEVDGGQHHDQKSYDNYRTSILNNSGFQVIRFWCNEVLLNVNLVLQSIYENINKI